MLFALAFVSSQAVFALFAGQVLGFSAFQTAMVFTGMGIMTAINQGLLLKRFWLKKFTETSIEIGAIGACCLGMILIAFKSVELFWIALVFLGFSQSLLRVVITSQVAGHADPSMKGETIGILGAIMAACMVIGPIIAGAAFEVNPAFPYCIGAGYMALSLLFAYPVWTKGTRFGKEAEEAINDPESMKMYVD
jgi:MFS family permease